MKTPFGNYRKTSTETHVQRPTRFKIAESGKITLMTSIKIQSLNPHQILTIGKLKEPEMTVKDTQCALDYPITIKEIQHKLKTLKNGKACSIDSVNSEMLKHSNLRLQLARLG